VRSVLLFSHRPAPELTGRRVVVSRSSMTSVALLELLFESVWHASPEFVGGDAEMEDISRFGDDPHDARLVIGDAALLLREGSRGAARYAFVYDLGAEWKAWTGLPFVFALWVAQRSAAPAESLGIHASLIASRDWGLANLDALAGQAAVHTGVDRSTCRAYFDGLDYGLGYEYLAGLTEFFRRLAAAGRVPAAKLSFLAA
jgi:chorismate dehydratase